MKMDSLILVHVSIICLALFAPQVAGLFGSQHCTQTECRHPRGHYHFVTSQTSLQSMAFGRDIRTVYVTIDYRSRFDIVLFIKNLKNVDIRLTQVGISAFSPARIGSNSYVTLTSATDRLVHFTDVTNVQISLVSYQNDASLDVYYFMNCGVIGKQFADLKYPEPPNPADPILQAWDLYFRGPRSRPLMPKGPRTCWFVVPIDNYSGRNTVEQTYVLIRNATLLHDVTIKVSDAINGKQIMSFPTLGQSVDLCSISKQKSNETVSVGLYEYRTSILVFVELVCPTRWRRECARNSKFEVLFKPLIKDDLECMKIEEKCRFGRGNVTYTCKPEEIPAKGSDLSITGEAFTTSKCAALNDLLQTIKSTFKTPGADLITDQSRMGFLTMCSNLRKYCSSSIRTCSYQGSCSRPCFMMHSRGSCYSF